MRITFFGTTTLLFDDGTDQVMFDAHFTRPLLVKYIFGSASTDRAVVDEKLRLHNVDRLRAIFVSHSHHDHVMDAPYVANACGAQIYGSRSALNVARGGDVPASRLTEFHGNETFRVGSFRVTVIPSLHSKPTILNNDLGQTIDAPLRQPARLRDYKEGGSFDFYVEADGKSFMIRPSFNYIEGQMDGYRADVLFLGTAGLQKADANTEAAFFRETVDKLRPKLVIPLHWDNFFSPLTKPARGMPRLIERTEVAFFKLARYCEAKDINCLIQLPGTSVDL
ncbi:MAG: MBL fold metallo-hydrolase [Clostridiales bacterium]|nr:MBL fold metallo-hydrolase [Clostridiales bacterium]